MKTVDVPIYPIDAVSRLRKLASDATEDNCHDEAFILETAASLIAVLWAKVEGKGNG